MQAGAACGALGGSASSRQPIACREAAAWCGAGAAAGPGGYTPEGLEFAAAELGARMETSIGMAKMWEAERFVRAGRTNQSGLKLLIAKANGGDLIWFMATVNRIAEILRLQGDMDSAGVRRSKAIGILAQPPLALQLLWEFRNQQQAAPQPQQPDEPIQNEPIAPFDHSTAAPADDVIETAAEETAQAASWNRLVVD
jgi:hypothetical protein